MEKARTKTAPVANRRTNEFAEGGEFFDQLLTLERSPVDPVRAPGSGGERRAEDPNRVDDFQRAYGRIEI